MTLDRFQGCLLGVALGDSLGAPHEGGPIERALWRLIGTTSDGKMRWTDDTQMSVDVAESLVAKGVVDADDLAARFGRSYRWSRGYGPAAAKLLKRIRGGADWRVANRSVYPGGSYGNGGAMRAAPIGLFYSRQPAALVNAARTCASITHAHPLGLEGAVLVASATALALDNADRHAILDGAGSRCELEPFVARLRIAGEWLRAGSSPSPVDVRRQLGNGIAAVDSCVTAIYVAARFIDLPFADMHRFVVEIRGDVDSIGAMAGAVWGAANGASALPPELLARVEQRERIASVAGALYAKTK